MGKKLTIEEVRKRTKIKYPSTIILSTEYTGARGKLKCYCTIHDHEWETTSESLNAGHGCAKCAGDRIGDKTRRNMNDIRSEIEVINPLIRILDEVYKSAHTKMRCECLVDGYIFEAPYSTLKKGHGCPKCSNSVSPTINEMKEELFIISPTILILSEAHTHSLDRVDCECSVCKNQWDSLWGNLRKGYGCPECANKKVGDALRYTLEEVVEKLSKITKTIKILSDEYLGANIKMECECLVCKNIWMAPWSTLSVGSGCPECAHEKGRGDTSPGWRGGITAIGIHLRNQMSQWRKDSMRACGYKCVITGERFDYVHHIFGFNMILEETFKRTGIPKHEKVSDYNEEELKTLEDICLEIHYEHELGACLTSKLHIDFHNIYNYGNNTPEQFEEFKNNYKTS